MLWECLLSFFKNSVNSAKTVNTIPSSRRPLQVRYRMHKVSDCPFFRRPPCYDMLIYETDIEQTNARSMQMILWEVPANVKDVGSIIPDRLLTITGNVISMSYDYVTEITSK